MTDAGPVPVGVVAQVAGAHTAGVLALIPTTMAVTAGSPTLPLLAVQAALTLVLVVWSVVRQRPGR